MKDKILNLVCAYGPLAARILIGGMFLFAAYGKVTNFAYMSGYVASGGLPMPNIILVLVIILEIVAGLSLVLGWRARRGGAALALFTLLATFIFHTQLSDPNQLLFFQKNLAIVGGLIYIVAYGAGPLSMDNKRNAPAPSQPPAAEGAAVM